MVMKRVFDIVVSSVTLFVLSPVILLVGVWVWLTLGSPVLFRQARPGRGGAIFQFYKFRTMAPGSGSDEARLTPSGKLIRKTSLDELPQLWNVLKGEMSLIGPRPLLPEYLPLYTPFQMRRHEVLPGITGWAQVNGRNAISWEKKFELDVWYVDHRSFWLDLRILFLTALRVIRRDGISAAGVATATKFTGSPPSKLSDIEGST